MELIGWIGSIMFSICALPQVVYTYKAKCAKSLDWLFLWLWFWGEIFTIVYVYGTTGLTQLPLLANYGFNTILVVSLLMMKRTYG